MRTNTFAAVATGLILLSWLNACTLAEDNGPVPPQSYRTPVTNHELSTDAGAVSLLYQPGGFGHNAILYEWFDETSHAPRARLVTYGATGPIGPSISVASTKTIQPSVESVGEAASATAATKAKQPEKAATLISASGSHATEITETLRDGDLATGAMWSEDDDRALAAFKNNNWGLRASWRRSLSDINAGLARVTQIQASPPNYALGANLPLIDIEKDTQNCLSMAAVLLHATGITHFNNVFILSPAVWKPKGDL